MGKRILTSFVPVVAAFAAFFLVLPSTGADATVVMTGEQAAWVFEPASPAIVAGERIAFRNDSGVTHTADCVECPWRSGDVQPGETAFVTLAEAGTFTFRCRYHPELMTGEATVAARA